MDAQLLAPFADLSIAALALAAGFVGGLVRGYSGFGFALAAVPLLSLGVPPVVAVPPVLIHELGVGLLSLKPERENVSWPVFGTLAAGSLIGSPLGLALLRGVPADCMRLVVGVAVALSVAFIWRSPRLPFRLERPPLLFAGIASGLLNGGTAMSGPPAVVILLGSNLPPRSVRGVLAFFIVFSAMIGVLLSFLAGMQGLDTTRLALCMAPGVIAGVSVGRRLFAVLPAAHYRRISLAFLMLVSVVSLSAALHGLA